MIFEAYRPGAKTYTTPLYSLIQSQLYPLISIMKVSVFVIAASIISTCQGFVVTPTGKTQSTQLNAASVDRRELLLSSASALATGAFLLAPEMAWAKDYEPRFDDMKQIYYLGASLDNLVKKLGNPDSVETALDGVRMFNRDKDFYTGYAKNYVLKIIKKGGDADARVGYIRQASQLISSVEDVASGYLADEGSVDEAIKRVKKAQVLIGKFLAECGVKDEKFDEYIKAHP